MKILCKYTPQYVAKICSYGLCILALALASLPSLADDSSFEFSGFGRIVSGAIDDDSLSFVGYDNELSFSEQSLLAIRGDFSYSEKLSVVAQVLGHSGESRKSGVQWLYLQYEPTTNLSFKLGRQRIPFFNYSDVIDVGFAYDWISPPIQVYTNYVFSDFDGLTSRYKYSASSITGSLNAYYGFFEGELVVSGDRREADVQYVFGLAGDAQWRNFLFSAAYHEGSVSVINQELSGFQDVLRQLNFLQSANSLDIDGNASFYKLGLSYETIDYYIRSEFTAIRSDILFVPDLDAGYLSMGYHFPAVLLHATLASSDAQYGSFPSEIPFGVNPQLDALGFGYQQVINSLPVDSLDSFTVGIRYDYTINIALKAELSFLSGKQGDRAFFDVIDSTSQKPEALLYQFAVEWIF
ncbi:hypothetical protein ISG33_15785 [Glaciecola sp. MH2013]|uniref:hypothetical protein n=1 Tax=Glaciecola sp. MH2013 TaxID=2785524 RepID=UPI00189F2313|nr:hypothetical protein [Glaciecola sp. MH2013]MBF7074863.1 hypothetical protein [Glaciecola sp. MH2013]